MGPINLRGDEPSHELVSFMEALLDAAKRGAMTGITVAAQFRGQKFFFESAGTLRRQPVLALGAATMLVADLEHRSRRQSTDTVL